MADANESNAEEVVENTEVVEATDDQEVELDQFIEVEGDVVENPVLEEEEDAEAEDATEETQEEDSQAEEDTPSENAAEIATEAAVEQPVEQAAKVDDPGEFTPKNDYSFEVTTTDGKTVKISNQAEADAFAAKLDESPDLITVSQLTKFSRGLARMDSGLEREKADYETAKQAFDDNKAAEEARENQVNQWSKEITYLRNRGLLPKPDPKVDSDWNANKEEPGVKEALEVFAWMDKENKLRDEAGISRVTSAVDAFQMMQAEQAQSAAAEEKTREGDARRAAGSKVKGNAPFVPGNAPKNSIIGEGGSLNDLIYEAQMGM